MNDKTELKFEEFETMIVRKLEMAGGCREARQIIDSSLNFLQEIYSPE